jgi:hypothetical protein
MSHRRRSTLEKKIQADIEAAIGSEPGHAKYFDPKTGHDWHVPYGLTPGSPDLVSMLLIPELPFALSVWFCLEVKADSGELTDEQETCHAIWRRFGALISVVRSVEEARAALEIARLKVREAMRVVATRAA